MALIMQHSGEASVRLRTTATNHFLMIESESVLVQKEPGESGYESSAKSSNLGLYYTDYCISLQSPLKTKSNCFNPCHIILLLWLFQTYRPADILQFVCLLRNIAGDWKKGKSNLPESPHQLK